MKKAAIHKHSNKIKPDETNPECKWLHNYKEIETVIKKKKTKKF